MTGILRRRLRSRTGRGAGVRVRRGRARFARAARVGLAVLSGLGAGCATVGSGPVHLDVFGCLMPVPSGYAFNTSDSSTTHAYQAGDRIGAWGELNVWPYDGPTPPERFEQLRSERRGPLTIEEIRPLDAASPAASIVVVSDGIQKLSLGGEAKLHVDAMVEECLASLR